MNVQKLDTHTYQELFAEALEEWQQRSGEEPLPSDVSYTLLEMQTMLADMLNYYSNQVQDAHLRKYEKLLGRTEAKPIPAVLPFRMIPECPITIWQGQQFFVHRDQEILTLEATHCCHLTTNTIESIYVEKDHSFENITELLRTLEGTYTLSMSDELICLYVRLKEELPCIVPFTLYVCVENSCRKDVACAWPDMAELELDYYSIHGWQRVGDLEDDTHSLLCNGELRFQLGKKMAETVCFQEKGYWLRLCLKNPCYDHPVGLQAIWMNVLLLEAHNTLAKTWNIPDLTMTRLCIAEDIAKESCLLQIQNKDGDWLSYPYHKQDTPSEIIFYWDQFPEDTIAARLLAQRSSLAEKVSSFAITGISSQTIDIAPLSEYSLAFQTAPDVYQDGEIIDQFEQGSGNKGCYRTEKGIILGNGRDFQLPCASENGLLFTSFVQLPKEIILHPETVEITHPNLIGHNALGGSLYETPYQESKMITHQEELIDILLHYPLLKLSHVRVQTSPKLWNITLMDVSDHACHFSWYRQYVHHLVQPLLPLGDQVLVQDMRVIEITICLYRTQSLSPSEKTEAERICGDYLERCRKQEDNAKMDDIRHELREKTSILISGGCFISDREQQVLDYQVDVLYDLQGVQCVYRH